MVLKSINIDSIFQAVITEEKSAKRQSYKIKNISTLRISKRVVCMAAV